MKRGIFIVLVLIGYIFVIEPISIWACSGGAPLTIQGLLNNSDYVVKAHAVESDDAGQNAILRVESYLYGGAGPEYLLFDRNNPIIVEYLMSGRSSGGDCLGLWSELSLSEPFYIFLERNQNGSYSSVTTLFNSTIYSFPDSNSMQEIYLQGGARNGDRILPEYAEKGTGQDVTEQEFVDIIADESGAVPQNPDETLPYPLKSPLLIMTETGTNYILPIDWHEPFLDPEQRNISIGYHEIRDNDLLYLTSTETEVCPDTECAMISPDRLNIVSISEENVLEFTWRNFVDGQAILFSATSDAVAIWSDCQLSVYSLGYPRLIQEWYSVVKVNSLELDAENCAIFHQIATWSPDGRMLAFADEVGIKLWDVFTDNNNPKLLIENDNETIHLPNLFSPQGRYLHYLDSELNHYIDLVSGEILPDGLFSPDDRILLSFDTNLPYSEFQICVTTPFSCAETYPMFAYFLDDNGGLQRVYDLAPNVSDIQWQNSSTFLALACTYDDEYDRCAIFEGFSDFFGWNREHIANGIGFDYDVQNHTLAYVRDATTIVVTKTELDTSLWFDEEVQEVRWLPSLFYYD